MGRGSRRASTAASVAIGLGIALTALIVYTAAQPFRIYDHFEWQAQAFLEGQTAIRYPVGTMDPCSGNACFNDVRPVESSDGVPRGDMPFPPLPAVVLLPFVALWGREADGQLIFAILAAVDVGLAWWMLGRLPIRRAVRVATTVFFAFGTVFWYSAQLGDDVVPGPHPGGRAGAAGASASRSAAIRDAAIDEDDLPYEDDDEPAVAVAGADRARAGRGGCREPHLGARPVRHRPAPVPRRPPVRPRLHEPPDDAVRGAVLPARRERRLVAAARAVRRRRRRDPGRRAAALQPRLDRAAVPSRATSTCTSSRPAFYTNLGYHLDWAIEDPRYIPQNLWIMLFNAPAILPDVYPAGLGNGQALCVDPGAVRGLFDPDCPIALPRDTGMSLLLTSPAYLFAIPALRRYGMNRLITGSALAILIVTFVNLMHFSQGWVQFGYRFSLDFVPWALVLVALGMQRVPGAAGRSRSAACSSPSRSPSMPGASIWGNVLGW